MLQNRASTAITNRFYLLLILLSLASEFGVSGTAFKALSSQATEQCDTVQRATKIPSDDVAGIVGRHPYHTIKMSRLSIGRICAWRGDKVAAPIPIFAGAIARRLIQASAIRSSWHMRMSICYLMSFDCADEVIE